jgi:hypothetical protein
MVGARSSKHQPQQHQTRKKEVLIMRLPVDTNLLSFICAGTAEPVVDYESRRPKTDENGTPLFQVALVAMSDGVAEVIAVKVPGEPKGVTQGAQVRLAGLVAVPWAMGDRSGIAYRATHIEANPPARTGS